MTEQQKQELEKGKNQNSSLQQEPDENKRTHSDKELMLFLFKYVRNHSLLLIGLILTFAFYLVFVILTPVIYRELANQIEQNRSGTTFNFFLLSIILYIIFGFATYLTKMTQFMLIEVLNTRFVRDLRIDVFSKLLENKLEFFTSHESGDLTSRVVNDTEELREYATLTAFLIIRVIKVIIILAVLLYYAAILTSIISLLYPVIFFILFLLGKYERRVSREWRDNFGKVNQKFSEQIKSIHVAKAFNREEENINQFKNLNELTFQAAVKRGLGIFIVWPVVDLFRNLVFLIIIMLGLWLTQHGLPIATLILFLFLLNDYYYPVVDFALDYTKVQALFSNLDRIITLIDDETLKEDVTTGLQYPITGELEFDNVSFAYKDEKYVLKNISFQVLKGEKLAIVGHTGAGKTTIAALILGLYQPQQGKVLIDGIELTKYNLPFYRKQVALVAQNILLFQGTIKENLLIAKPHASDEEIWKALETVQAKEFVEKLPGKLQYKVKEGGKNLSKGQRQMISFARAILKKPKILVLDEATAAVDLYTETKIQQAIDILLQQQTSITIAHRLTTIVNSDKIIYMEQGKIVEQGTLQELLENQTKFKKMYELYHQTQSVKYLEKIKKPAMK